MIGEAYHRDIRRYALLTPERERTLGEAAAAGDEGARAELVTRNLRLVVSIAQRFAGQGLDREDLVAAGNLGLIRAAEDYDARRGARFTTYAGHWIGQRIRKALEQHGRTVRRSSRTITDILAWRRLCDELGRPATLAELTTALAEPGRRPPVGRARRALRCAMRTTLSLDDGADEDDDDAGPLAQCEDPTAPDPAEQAIAGEELAHLAELLDALSERERLAVRLRYGLGDETPRKYADVGAALGVGRNRARVLVERALQRMRAVAAGDELPAEAGAAVLGPITLAELLPVRTGLPAAG